MNTNNGLNKYVCLCFGWSDCNNICLIYLFFYRLWQIETFLFTEEGVIKCANYRGMRNLKTHTCNYM